MSTSFDWHLERESPSQEHMIVLAPQEDEYWLDKKRLQHMLDAVLAAEDSQRLPSGSRWNPQWEMFK